MANTLNIAASGMASQSDRLRRISENIANVDTPGYHRKTVAMFSDQQGLVRTGRTEFDQTELQDIFDPTHPLADAMGHYQGSNVNLLVEVADAREAQRSYDANLKLFEQSRQMTSELFDLLKK